MALHRVGVDLAHVPALVRFLDVLDAQLPDALLGVGHGNPLALGNYQRFDRQDRLGVHPKPRDLLKEESWDQSIYYLQVRWVRLTFTISLIFYLDGEVRGVIERKITLYLCKSCTVHVITPSRPTGTVTLEIGALNLGSTVCCVCWRYTK